MQRKIISIILKKSNFEVALFKIDENRDTFQNLFRNNTNTQISHN